jgi:glycosyltransferase involved in cell wall biosynthesis
VTATHKRPELLLGRCIPSVAAQTYQPLEHLVVVDGPDQPLAWRLERLGYRGEPGHGRRVVELGQNHGSPGHAAHAAGAWLAAGEWVCYLDDDNEFDPGHVEGMVAEAGRAGAQLVCCAWRTPTGELGGWAPPGLGRTDTSTILHHRDLLNLASWDPGLGYAADGHLVEAWIAAGVRWSFLPSPSVTYHPADPASYSAWLATMPKA